MIESKISYKELLSDVRWKLKRNEILGRDKFNCTNCNATANLEVHHRQYHIYQSSGEFAYPWNYDGKYLITLCANCHAVGHKCYIIKTFTI